MSTPFALYADSPIARTGKIARLPRQLRETLNQRLADGQSGPQLLEWLNGLPEVQAVLAAEFEGRPIGEQNLSAWRQGGFVDWQRHQEARALLRALAEEEEELQADSGENGRDLAERVGNLILLALGRLVRALPADATPEEQRRTLSGVAQDLARLRRAGAGPDRARLAREQWEAQRAATEQEEKGTLTLEEKIRIMNEIFGISKEPAAGVNQGGSSQIKVDQGSASEAGGGAAAPSQPATGAGSTEPEAAALAPNQGGSRQIKVDLTAVAAVAAESADRACSKPANDAQGGNGGED